MEGRDGHPCFPRGDSDLSVSVSVSFWVNQRGFGAMVSASLHTRHCLRDP